MWAEFFRTSSGQKIISFTHTMTQLLTYSYLDVKIQRHNEKVEASIKTPNLK